MIGIQNPKLSCADGYCLTNADNMSLKMNQATTGKGATEPLTGSGWQMSLLGLNLPRFAHRRGKGKISRLKQAKGGRTPDTLSAVDGEGSVSAAPTPFS